MHDFDLHEARAFAEDLARQAADITREYAGPVPFERKHDQSPVTEVDRRIETMLREAVTQRYPDHAFLGEELGSADDASRRSFTWVVDPLDGTRNFAHGFPCFATSIALMHERRSIVGVIREHGSGWHASAVAGEGVLCNGRHVTQPDPGGDRETLIAAPSGRNLPILPFIEAWIDRYNLRNIGSTALHMAYLAAGAVDAVLCRECKLWDVAAGSLLITESGANITKIDGTPFQLPHPTGYRNEDFPFFAAAEHCDITLRNDLKHA